MNLVQSDGNISPNSRCQMNLRLQIQLDSQQQRGILLLAIVVDRAFDDVSCRPVECAG